MKKIVPIATALGLSAFVLGSYYNYKKAIARSNKSFLNTDPDMPSDTVMLDVDKTNGRQWLIESGAEDITLTAFDGLALHATYIPAARGSNRCAVIAHGYSGKGRNMISVARFYRDQLNCNVLLPDARGHGQSAGHYIGFGWHDRLDQLKWLHHLILKHGEEAQILLHGVSMGAATVLMTTGEAVLPSQVIAAVSDCAYTSAFDELAHQLQRLYHLPAFPMLYGTDLVTRLNAGYSIREASALEQVKKSSVPTLFIHGDHDAFVPYEMVYQLYDACHAPKALYIVPGAGHGNAYRIAGSDYERAILNFVTPFLK